MELISREDAIKALEEVTCDICEHRSTWCALCDKAEVLTRIHSLPTIEERKVGHWISGIGDKCSVCGMTFDDLYPLYNSASYCPNCGARMQSQINATENTDENE